LGIADEEQETFEIDFSTFRPVILELRDQRIRIGIRGTRFSQGARELARPLEITAVYEPQRSDDGTMLLRRSGDVSVDFPGGRRLTIQQVALRRTIQRLFADRFPQTLLDRPLIIPDFNEAALLEVRTLRTSLIDARDGRSEEHTSELQSREKLVCRLLLEKKNTARSTRKPL